MRSLVAGAGMRLGAVQNADQAAYLLMYRTPVFLLVGVAAVVGDSAPSALHVSWFLTQLTSQLHAFRRCQGID